MPLVGTHDLFEQAYTAELRVRLSPHGQIIRYEQDRAALDLGLHLYDVTAAPGVLSQVRVWFQLKGITQSTLAADDIAGSDAVAVSGLRTEHIRYWFAHPEPVYLVVFVESVDEFLAADVRDLVERRGGIDWIREPAQSEQQTATLHVPVAATLDDALRRMPRHRTMRLDGPEFRGRPLGHRLDPLRSALDVMPRQDFETLVARLLSAHGYVAERELDASIFGEIGAVQATVGRLHFRYEWTSPLFTQFGYDENDSFRDESPPFHAQGNVAVVVHSDVQGVPRTSDETADLVARLGDEGVDQALVFINASEGAAEFIGGWRMGPLHPLVQFPQGLGSLAYNVLIATNVFLEFVERLPWRIINVQ